MTRDEHILQTISEECAEVIKEISKALRFGLDDVNPDEPAKGTNRYRIEYELEQLRGMVHLATAEGLIFKNPDQHARVARAKIDKFEGFLEWSRRRGALTE